MYKEVCVFEQLIRDDSGCASYVIGSRAAKKCILVDPLMDTERYEEVLKRNGLEIAALVDTHTHADHLSGLRAFSQIYPRAEIAIHESAPAKFEHEKLRDGQELDYGLGKEVDSMKVMHTPGHASDHVCLLIRIGDGKMLLSGDCLFIGDVGRTDLGRGDNEKMYDSLFGKLLRLDSDTEVYPAHVGKKHFLSSSKVKTTIGAEANTNPALKVRTKEEFFNYMTEGWPPKPGFYHEIININLGDLSLVDAQEEILEARRGESYQHAREEKKEAR